MTVTIGIDPHKRSHTAVALCDDGSVVGELRLDASNRQLEVLLRFAGDWPDRVWAVENANGLGRLLSRQLQETGETVVDVPAKLAARVRALSGAGHKTDAHDARSTAIAARHGLRLRSVDADDDTVRIGLLAERRWQLVAQRQKTLCRLHDHLTCLLPGGAPKGLRANTAAALLRRVRPTEPVAAERKAIAKELIAEVRSLDTKIKAANARLDDALKTYQTTLTDIDGIARVGAASIIALVGDVTRFPTEAAFASFNGTAPIAASSGDLVRYRLNPGGQRQANRVLHTAAKVQIRMRGSAGRAYYERRLAEGKRPAEAVRALKRHLSNRVYRCLLDDAAAKAAARGGHEGNDALTDTVTPRGRLASHTGSSGQSLPGPTPSEYAEASVSDSREPGPHRRLDREIWTAPGVQAPRAARGAAQGRAARYDVWSARRPGVQRHG